MKTFVRIFTSIFRSCYCGPVVIRAAVFAILILFFFLYTSYVLCLVRNRCSIPNQRNFRKRPLSTKPMENQPESPSSREQALNPPMETSNTQKIFGIPLSYLYSNSELCSKGNRTKPVENILVVMSRPQSFALRQAIRSTFVPVLKRTLNFEAVFFVGTGAANSQGNFLDLEAKQYGDVVIGNFAEHYKNLTLKTAFALNWIVNYCPHTDLMLKTDDDTFLFPKNVERLVKFGRRRKGDRWIAGRIEGGDKGGPDRNPSSKWYLDRAVYAPETFPVFVGGHSYAIHGRRSVRRLLQGALSYSAPYFPLEDVFFTGLMAEESGIPRISTFSHQFLPEPLPFFALCQTTVISCHYISSAEQMGWYFQQSQACEDSQDTDTEKYSTSMHPM